MSAEDNEFVFVPNLWGLNWPFVAFVRIYEKNGPDDVKNEKIEFEKSWVLKPNVFFKISKKKWFMYDQ